MLVGAMKRDAEDNGCMVSSGNVFADLGVAEPAEALAKAELAPKIGEIVAKRHLTQAAAAELLGIDQPKVSALVRGNLTGFSIERLFRLLNALDRDVEIVVKRRPRTRGSAGVRVLAV
jgi:predicted XRE-type DNA-binding protein